MAEFAFSSDVVRFYIWSFRHVPLPPEYNYFIRLLTMTSLDSTFLKPPSFELKGCLMRGLWTQFDHFSDLDPTFRCGFLEAVPDLIAAQDMEWNDRYTLKNRKLQQMAEARAKYEVDKKQKELEALESAKNSKIPNKPAGRKKAKKKSKKGKLEKPALESAPPIVTEDTSVNVDEEYEQRELEHYLQKMEQISPSSLDLADEYVNLRRFRVTGGVFSINQFEKLPQSIEMRCDFMYRDVPLDLKLIEKKFVSESDTELIKIEIKLPDYCFWWKEPLVCSWEIWEDSDEFNSLGKEHQELHLNYEKIMEEKSKLLFGSPKPPKHPRKPTVIPDFDINDIPSEIKLHFLIQDHILPRLPQNYKFYAEMHQLFVTMQEKFVHEQRLKIEEALNEILYPKFLALKATGFGEFDEFRVPGIHDVPEGEGSVVSLSESMSSSKIKTPVESMLLELSLAQKVPAYLFPPEHKIPLLIITEKKEEEPSSLDIDEMILDLYDAIVSDDEFSAESVCNMFSTFLNLLDRLREREIPVFPEPESEPEKEEEETAPPRKQSIGSRGSTHFHPPEVKQLSRRLSSFVIAKKKKPREKNVKIRKKVRKHSVVTPSEISSDEEHEFTKEDPEPLDLELLPHTPGRWTTKLIQKQEFDSDGKVITVWVNKLASFGFAMEKYHNIPFKGWEMRRTGKISELSTMITLNCVELTVCITVSKSGYQISFQNAPQDIKPPEADLNLEELQKFLTKVNLTLFPEPDASFYVQNMTSPKHESMEVHTLKCLAVFCLTHNFKHCFWNKYTGFRVALVENRQIIERRPDPDFVTIMVNPLEAATVAVEELCSPLDQVLLKYHPVPENQPYNPDVYNLLQETLEEPSRKLLLRTPPMLQWNVSQLLLKLRLLSFS
ncbi:uncharacterized protein LOC129777300 isoform X2 [Toxorhynchites rutilus septentrionalis]|nr:uncharacterized protein LOC129777300 isoform X2 [Toxorhynchites rutilus septentrionalis]